MILLDNNDDRLLSLISSHINSIRWRECSLGRRLYSRRAAQKSFITFNYM